MWITEIQHTIGPAGLFAIVGVGVLVIVLKIMKFVVRKGRKLFLFCVSLISTLWNAALSHKDIQAWSKKHAGVVQFLQARFSRKSFWGLPVTFLAVGFIYALLAFVGVVHSIATAGVFATADVRIENLFFAFRSVPVTVFFLWVTILGAWQVWIFILAGVSLILFASKYERFIVPLWVAVLGSQLVGLISKHEVHRLRPEGIAVYVERSFSFPSAHAILAVALYGFLTYIAMHAARKWRHKIYLFFIGLTIIFLIGLSRLYVGVHYVSDVWGGYLLGFLWLVIGISLANWSKFHQHRRLQISRLFHSKTAVRVSTVIAVIGMVSAYVYMGQANVRRMIAHTPTLPLEDHTTNSSLAIFSDGAPQYSETILGNPQEPISFIVAASSENEFVRALEQAGWLPAEHISSKTLIRLARIAATKGSYPTAPMTPSFWNQEVNDFGFQKPTPADSIEQRHHARFWRTPYITETGKRIYVGTVSLDTHIKWFITHAIAPDIDSEREILLGDLEKTGMVDHVSTVQFVAPRLGKNIFGDPFFTDGKTHVVELK